MTTATETTYFSHMNPNCAIATERTAARRADYRSWISALPPLDEDFDVACQRLVAKLGLGPKVIMESCAALHRLTQLPGLKNLQETLYLLDMRALLAIDRALTKLGTLAADKLAFIDAALVDFLTPTRPNQNFPTPAQIGRKVRDICRVIDKTVAFRDTRPKDTYTMTDTGERASLELTTDSATGIILHQFIKDTAKEHNISTPEALKKLISGTITPSATVILHTYQATDIPNAPTFVQGHEWTAADLPATRTRDLSAEPLESDSYVASELIRKFVEGRDGTCRALGCTRPAWQCQMDHRINYAEGGPTHPRNLASLCQHHHNMKTDGRAHYIMDPITGDVVWLFEDGTWAMTEPSGPLAPKTKRWAQTVAQKITADQKRAHDKAQQLKKELDEDARTPEPSTPQDNSTEDTEDIPF